MAAHRSFGQVLRELRDDARMSQEDLAEAANLHRTYIGLLERDKRVPTLDTLFALAKGLKIRASIIISRMER